MISMDKKYRTDDGASVRLLCNDRKGDRPVVGLISRNGRDQIQDWGDDGRHRFDPALHLVEVKTKHNGFIAIKKEEQSSLMHGDMPKLIHCKTSPAYPEIHHLYEYLDYVKWKRDDCVIVPISWEE